jgi:hypothetical protein
MAVLTPSQVSRAVRLHLTRNPDDEVVGIAHFADQCPVSGAIHREYGFDASVYSTYIAVHLPDSTICIPTTDRQRRFINVLDLTHAWGARVTARCARALWDWVVRGTGDPVCTCHDEPTIGRCRA